MKDYNIKQLVEVVGKLRGDMNRRFDEMQSDMDNRFNGIHKEMNKRFKLLNENLPDV